MINKHCKFILILIIILQICTICYWAGEKSNYNIDEFYSLGYAQFFNHPRKLISKVTSPDDWQYETWVKNSILKDKLIQTEEESILKNDPLTVIRKLLLDKYDYYGFLNISRSLFSDGSVSLLPGLILNLCFFLITQLVLFRITEELSGNEAAALMAAFMYGFSLLAVGMTVYIRFYAMVSCMFMAALRLHQIMRRTEDPLRFVLLTVLSAAILLIGMRNSQLVFVLGTALVFFYTISLLIGRKYRSVCLYLLTFVPAGLYYVIRKTNFLEVIFQPEKFLTTRSSETTVAYGLTRLTGRRLLPLARSYLKMFCYQLFGSRTIFTVFCVLLAALAVLWLFRKGKSPADGSGKASFSLVIFAVMLVYVPSALMANLTVVRYICFVFPMAAILIWTWLDLFTRGRRYRKPVLAACVILAFGAVVSSHLRHPEAIQYIYQNDRTLSRTVADSGIDTAIVVYTTANWSSEHAVYDCVNMLPDSAMLYPVYTDHSSIDVSECPDKMLIWASRKLDKTIEPYTADLTAAGYYIYKIGRNHTSDVYIAERTSSRER